MSTREKRPAIYMIRNKINGKVYIGATQDVQARFRRYIYNYTHYSLVEQSIGKDNVKRDIESTIHKEGWDNFEFTIIESDSKLLDNEYRALREIYYIMKYRSIDPECGYNSTIGGDVPHSNKHPKALHIPMKAKIHSTLTYDTETGDIELQLRGVYTLSKKFDQSKETLRWTIRNGTCAKSRYYIFYTDKESRDLVYDFIVACKSELSFSVGGNSNKAVQSLTLYTDAYRIVSQVAKNYGY